MLALLKSCSGKLAYMPIMMVAMALLMVKPILMARFFRPEEFAAYSSGLLISSTFCMFGCLGLYNELQRDMPVKFYAGLERKAFVLLLQAALVAAVCFVLLGLGGFSSVEIAGLGGAGLTVGVFHGFSQQLFLLSTVESKSRGETLRFSHQLISKAVLVITIAVFVGWKTDSAVATLLTEAVISLLLGVGIVVRAVSRFSLVSLMRLAVRQLARINWPDALTLMGVTMVTFMVMNLDRWLAGVLMPARDFAIYAFAWVVLMAAQAAQAMVNASVFPALAREYAASGRRRSFRLAGLISLLTLVAGVILAWPLCKLINGGISLYFPEYVKATTVVVIFYLGGVLRFSNFFSGFLIVVGKERPLLVINVATLLAGVMLWFAVFGLAGFSRLVPLAWFSLFLMALNYFAILVYAFLEGRPGSRYKDACSARDSK